MGCKGKGKKPPKKANNVNNSVLFGSTVKRGEEFWRYPA